MIERTVVVSFVRAGRSAVDSERSRRVCAEFGVAGFEPERTLFRGVRIKLGPGRIVFITGPSGAGKSTLMRAICAECGGAVDVGARVAERGVLVDAILPGRTLSAALQLLTACGVGEPRLWLRRFDELSAGEQFRGRLARAIGRALTARDRPPIVCDEFAALLHPRAARALACNLRKLATRLRLTLVLASVRDEFVADLRPDAVVRMGGDEPEIISGSAIDAATPWSARGRIEPGGVRDYDRFAAMHYRGGDRLGFVDRVFVLRETPGGEPLGVAVFAMPPIELALRNHATAGRFVRNPRRLNRELRILRRLVIHPDVRGCGVGQWFVRQTLPRVGTRFVECLAAMGTVTPLFERAGMMRVGRTAPPRGRMALLERMVRMRVDPFAADFAESLRRNSRVRRMIEQTLHDWLRATTGGRARTAAKCGPGELAMRFRRLIGEPPVYYLWDREGEFPRKSSVECDRHDPFHEKRGRGRSEL